MVAPYGRNGRLFHPPRGNWTSAGDNQHQHEPWLQLCQTQSREPPWHFLQTNTHHPYNYMDHLKVCLESSTPREGLIPTTSQIPHGVCQNEQPGGPEIFWNFYAVHALGLMMRSFHQYLLWALHTVQNPIKGGWYTSQWHQGDHWY